MHARDGDVVGGRRIERVGGRDRDVHQRRPAERAGAERRRHHLDRREGRAARREVGQRERRDVVAAALRERERHVGREQRGQRGQEVGHLHAGRDVGPDAADADLERGRGRRASYGPSARLLANRSASSVGTVPVPGTKRRSVQPDAKQPSFSVTRAMSPIAFAPTSWRARRTGNEKLSLPAAPTNVAMPKHSPNWYEKATAPTGGSNSTRTPSGTKEARVSRREREAVRVRGGEGDLDAVLHGLRDEHVRCEPDRRVEHDGRRAGECGVGGVEEEPCVGARCAAREQRDRGERGQGAAPGDVAGAQGMRAVRSLRGSFRLGHCRSSVAVLRVLVRSLG